MSFIRYALYESKGFSVTIVVGSSYVYTILLICHLIYIYKLYDILYMYVTKYVCMYLLPMYMVCKRA